MKLLVTKKGKKYYAKGILLLNPTELKPLTNKKSMNIIKLLSKEPMYPAQIAKKLGMYIQKAYYYISQLEKNGIIKVVKEEMVKGGNAKYYGLNYSAFGIDIGGEEEEISNIETMEKNLAGFLGKMLNGNSFEGNIVVGSPKPHGPFNTGARDGHYAVHLGFFLGKYCSPKEFSVMLDIDAKAEKKLKNNLILVGGPGVNVVSYACNKKFPYFFNIKSSKYGYLMGGIVSKKTGEVYNDDNIGVIQKIKNPWEKSKEIIMIAGKKAIGTKAGIIALTKGYKKIFRDYRGGEYGTLIRGLDLDGDGKVDSIEVVED